MKRKSILAVFCLIAACAVSQAAPVRWWPQWEGHSKASGSQIQALQYLLRARGHKIAADGVFGKKTVNAVRAFQKNRKIIASGSLNSATWEALVPTIKLGSRGDAVRAAQILLRNADYNIAVDGIFGKSTRDAVLKFQKVRGSTRDGIVGLNTWCELVEGNVGEMSGE